VTADEHSLDYQAGDRVLGRGGQHLRSLLREDQPLRSDRNNNGRRLSQASRPSRNADDGATLELYLCDLSRGVLNGAPEVVGFTDETGCKQGRGPIIEVARRADLDDATGADKGDSVVPNTPATVADATAAVALFLNASAKRSSLNASANQWSVRPVKGKLRLGEALNANATTTAIGIKRNATTHDT
jgi:hypothetical protein